MARPLKAADQKRDQDLRIPVTAKEKERIIAACGPDGLAAWARGILLLAADAQLEAQKTPRKSRKTE